MDQVGAKGDPVLVDCRSSICYNSEEFDEIAYHGNNNRSPAVLNTQDFNIFARNSVNEINYNATLNEDIAVKESELAVCVQNVYKSYTEGHPILSNLCMNVKKGSIYGLLGSSGCGKTTLLTSIVGLQKWDFGQILLFNKIPKEVPPTKIGFMPQDIALFDQLSVRETIGYYGRLYGMTEKDIEKQWLWLVDFLQLPAKFKLTKDMSGGQQRRVSLAITLLHSPDLLILDEPTVGLDPLLRESIWKYLFNMVQTQQTTVIVTTHYIEEARLSNTIGVMRRGRLLVEDSPETLLQQHQCDLLEQVVLKLCRKDEEVSGRGSDISNYSNPPPAEVVISINKKSSSSSLEKLKSKNSYNVQEKMLREFFNSKKLNKSSSAANEPTDMKKKDNEKNLSSVYDRVMAMSIVIFLKFMRHPIFLAMILFLPTLQMILTLAVLGTHPKDMKFGVVNSDLPNYDDCFNNAIYSKFPSNHIPMLDDNRTAVAIGDTGPCDFKRFSCSIITQLSKTGTLKLVPIQSESDAYKEVTKGNLWGYYSFGRNYSQHLQDFVTARQFSENETLDGSQIHLTMDMSHYIGAVFAIRESYEAYENSAKNLASSCNVNPKEFSLPFEYRKPVFGKIDASYHDYVIPIVILTVVFEIPMLVTSILFINDRKQGTLNRSRVAGLRFKEVMVSNFLTQVAVIIGQTGICSAVLYLFYDFHVEGNYLLYFSIIILGGICGESLGLLLGVIFQEEVEALMFGIFAGPILLFYEGVLWPVEGMSKTVRTIAYMSPTTLTVESARSVIYRGVGFLHGHVWPGVVVMSAWIVAIWIVSILIFIRRYK